MAKNNDKEKGALVQREEMQPISPFEEIERYFDRFFQNPFSLLARPTFTPSFARLGEISPSVDIYEEDNEVIVKAEVPGINRDDIKVTVTENTLTIAGEKKQEEKVEKKDYHRIERSYGTFSRSFRLPENVDGDKAKAKFKDGVLEIRLPKVKESRERKIEIS